MGKKKGGGKASPGGGGGGGVGSAAAGGADEGPLWVERRRLEEDWGRSSTRVRQGLEGWREALRGLLRCVVGRKWGV